MVLSIVPYTADHRDAVRAFNQRLQRAGITMRFLESETPGWLPRVSDRRIYQEFFLAVEGETVRGGYILKHQDFQLGDRIMSIGNLGLPISEGIIDKRYGLLGVTLLNDVLRRQPLLYCLGIGSYEEPLARLLTGMGWKLTSVPFFFRVGRPVAFLRNVRFLRRTRTRRLLLDLLAFSGLGFVGINLMQMLSTRERMTGRGLQTEVFDNFGKWADHLWQESQSLYSLSAVRDTDTLNILYPAADPKFIKLKVSSKDKEIGWAVLLITRMTDNKFFGNMKLATIADCLALPGHAADVMRAARRYVAKSDADLLVTNQSHVEWQGACRRNGLISGPSNFIFATSPQLTSRLALLDLALSRIHFNRGDGDGPIHL